MISFLSLIDVGLQTSLFVKYKDILDLDTAANSVIYFPKGIAQREIAERRGKHELEFISYWKVNVSQDWNRTLTPAARRGTWMQTADGTQTINVKAVPVKMSYDIWFWSKSKDKLNQIAETYFFWQHTDPNLSMTYEDDYPLELDLHFGELVDESIVEQRYDKGMYFVYRMPLTLDGWIFTSTDPINNIIYSIHVEYYDKDEVLSYEEIIVPDDSSYDAEKATVLKLFSRTITE